MIVKKWEIWIADLNPQVGTEPGKTRPVIIIQSDLLNDVHPSTMICPITTKIEKKSKILRVHLRKGEANLKQASDILVDQIRAIDNKRFVKKVGSISNKNKLQLIKNISILLDINIPKLTN